MPTPVPLSNGTQFVPVRDTRSPGIGRATSLTINSGKLFPRPNMGGKTPTLPGVGPSPLGKGIDLNRLKTGQLKSKKWRLF